MNEALIRDGDLSPDLKAAVEKNKGTYLHRSYQIFEDNDLWKKWITTADPEAVRRVEAARALIEQDVIKQKVHEHAKAMKAAGTPVKRAKAIDYARSLPNLANDVQKILNDFIDIGDDPVAGRISLYGGTGRPGSKGLAIMKERGQVRKAIRELWGEWEDPAVNFTKTYTAIGTYLENNRFQRQVMEDGLASGYIWKEGVSTGPLPATWKPIVPEGSKAMDIMSGAYGPPLLRDAFAIMNSSRTRSELEAIVSRIASVPLAMKTVYSTGSIARNWFGNIAFVYGNGNFVGPYIKAGKTAWAEALKSGPDAVREYVKELTELGVLGESVGANMIKTLTEEAQKGMLDKKTAEQFSKLPLRAQKIYENVKAGFKNAYAGVDNYWKVYAYEAELGKLKWEGRSGCSVRSCIKEGGCSNCWAHDADIFRSLEPA
jgi:hypothetical protein